MKYFYFLLLFSFALAAQNDATYYLNEQLNDTPQGSHTYYQVITNAKTKGIYHQQTTYYLSGAVYSKGMFSKEDTPTGFWEFYYPNGNPKEKIFYDRVPSGYYATYYENGQMHLEGSVIKTSPKIFPDNVRINNYWNVDKTQVVRDGQGTLVVVKDEIVMEGKIKNGLKDSIWYGRCQKYNIDFAEVYKEGEFVSGMSVDAENISRRYKAIEASVEPMGGSSAFGKYFRERFEIPKKLKGVVRTVVSFVVQPNGTATDYQIVQNDHPGLAEAIIDILKTYPGWTPKSYRGVPMAVTYTLPLILNESNYEPYYNRDMTVDPSRNGNLFANPRLSGDPVIHVPMQRL